MNIHAAHGTQVVLYRLKATGTVGESLPEFYCGTGKWDSDRTKAESMGEDFAKGMANGLRLARQPQQGVDYYTYDTVVDK